MVKQYGYFEWDDSALRPGQKKEGGWHTNLYNEDGKLKGHARFIPGDIPEESAINPESDFYENFYHEHQHCSDDCCSTSASSSSTDDELIEAIVQLILLGFTAAVIIGAIYTLDAAAKMKDKIRARNLSRKQKNEKNKQANEATQQTSEIIPQDINTTSSQHIELAVATRTYTLTPQQYTTLLAVLQHYNSLSQRCQQILNNAIVYSAKRVPEISSTSSMELIEGDVVESSQDAGSFAESSPTNQTLAQTMVKLLSQATPRLGKQAR